jgi:hypothetical protein
MDPLLKVEFAQMWKHTCVLLGRDIRRSAAAS